MFIRFNVNPINKDTGDCVVRGVSLLMNQSWRDTYTDLSMTAYYLSDMPSSNAAWHEYLILNGYRRYVIPDTCPSCYTVKEFCMDHPKGRFLACTGSHVVAIIDGDYYDTWDSGFEVPVYYYERRCGRFLCTNEIPGHWEICLSQQHVHKSSFH